MTPNEFAYVTMLAASLMTRLAHANALTAAVITERDDLAKQLAAHVDSLKLSNAQCAEYLRQNEQLQAAKDEMQNALAEAIKDLAYSRLAVDTMCARDKRFTSTAARCGAGANEDVGDFIERTAAERGKLHSELVEVRAALAATTEQRDSMQRTLDEWDRADTKPHERVTADDVADHVVPPVLPMCNVCHGCGTALTPYGTVLRCPNQICGRTNTGTLSLLFNPYHDTCKSPTTVRHE